MVPAGPACHCFVVRVRNVAAVRARRARSVGTGSVPLSVLALRRRPVGVPFLLLPVTLPFLLLLVLRMLLLEDALELGVEIADSLVECSPLFPDHARRADRHGVATAAIAGSVASQPRVSHPLIALPVPRGPRRAAVENGVLSRRARCARVLTQLKGRLGLHV
eukprot:scaffold43813_cov55-Phaeocystis_antarctica.AAC.1